jgi:hypothetical protein
MTVEQFFAKYSDTPLDKRTEELDRIYFRLMDIQDEMRPLRMNRDSLLLEASNLLNGINMEIGMEMVISLKKSYIMD